MNSPDNTPAPAAPEPTSTIVDRLDTLFSGEPANTPPDNTPAPVAGEEAPTTPTPELPEDDSMAAFTKEATKETSTPEPITPTEPEVEEKTPEGMTEKAGAKWKEIKTELKNWKQKYEELSKKQAEAPPAAPVKDPVIEAEVSQLREKLSSYEKEIIGVKLEATAEYKQQVNAPLDVIRDTVQDLADTYEIDLEALNAAVVDDDRKSRVRKLAQLGEAMLEPDRLRLYKTAEDFDKVVDTKLKLEENASETLKRFEIERSEQQRKVAVEETRKQKEASEQMWELMTRRVPLLKDAEIAKAVRAEADTVDFSSADPGLRAYGAFAGAALPKVIKAIHEKDARIAALESQINALKGSSPSVGAPPVAPTGIQASSFLDAIEKSVGR